MSGSEVIMFKKPSPLSIVTFAKLFELSSKHDFMFKASPVFLACSFSQASREIVITAMGDAIIPIISQIQRELVLVIEYSPNKPIVLKMTRKRSFKLTEEEEFIVTQRKEFKKEVKYTLKSHTRSPKTNLLVSFPTGVKIKNTLAMNTFCEVVEKIGLQKVKNLNIRSYGSNLVSNIKNHTYRQKKSKNGYYIITQTSTSQKKKHLELISKKLNLDLIVEII